MFLVGCQSQSGETAVDSPLKLDLPEVIESEPGSAPEGMVWIPGGEYQLGSEQGMPDEAPVHSVVVDGFWIQRHEVTNDDFRAFVEATNYKTTAELKPSANDFPDADPELLVPGSLVFDVDSKGWGFVSGANWKHPTGPKSSLEGKGDHPVVHVSWDDAMAYSSWLGYRLPTEAEFEIAARGGHKDRKYIWDGTEVSPDGKIMANTWQGTFPNHDVGTDGFTGTSPVGTFPPNDYGLVDMAGNVWEWCLDFYRSDSYKNVKGKNPLGPTDSFDPNEPGIVKRVVRGGSFLCSQNYCSGYRPSARMKSSQDTGLFHTGFRCVKPANADKK